jgi:hypothetical protein
LEGLDGVLGEGDVPGVAVGVVSPARSLSMANSASLLLLVRVIAIGALVPCGTASSFEFEPHPTPGLAFVFANHAKQSENSKNSRSQGCAPRSTCTSGPRRRRVRPGMTSWKGRLWVARWRARRARVWACVWRDVFRESVTVQKE